MPGGEAVGETGPAVENSGWSERLLPVMVLMTVGLTLFFLGASVIQLNGLNAAIQDAPRLDLQPVLETAEGGGDPDALARLRAYISLEANLIERRHHEANVALMARIWTRYMGFMTGMTLAMVGAVFVLGRLSGGGALSGGLGTAKMSLQTASPGLFMIVLGSSLMIVTITNHPRISVVDRAIFLAPMPGAGGATAANGDESAGGLPALPEWTPSRRGGLSEGEAEGTSQ